jgi:hypothetical protein
MERPYISSKSGKSMRRAAGKSLFQSSSTGGACFGPTEEKALIRRQMG